MAFTVGPAFSCPESESEIKLELKTDFYVPESAWSVKNSAGVTVIERASNHYPSANTDYSENYCITPGEYEFEITDSYGDGICCSYGSGYYKMYEGSTLLIEGGQFTHSEKKSFTVGPAFSCPESESEIKLELKTDFYVPESAWSVKNSAGVTVIERASNHYPSANTDYSENYCITPGEYVFEITDSWGDGICCVGGNGYYKMYEGSTLLIEGGQFTHSESKSF